MDQNILIENLEKIFPIIIANLNPDEEENDTNKSCKTVAFDCLTNIASIANANNFDTVINPLLVYLDSIKWSPVQFATECIRALCVSMSV